MATIKKIKKAQNGMKERMKANKNPTFDFKTDWGKTTKMLTQTDTTGLAGGKKRFDYSKTVVNPENEKVGKTFYGNVGRKKLTKVIAKRTGVDKQKMGGKVKKAQNGVDSTSIYENRLFKSMDKAVGTKGTPKNKEANKEVNKSISDLKRYNSKKAKAPKQKMGGMMKKGGKISKKK